MTKKAHNPPSSRAQTIVATGRALEFPPVTYHPSPTSTHKGCITTSTHDEARLEMDIAGLLRRGGFLCQPSPRVGIRGRRPQCARLFQASARCRGLEPAQCHRRTANQIL